MNKKPLLIVFLGFPGSGKTYFSTRLAKKLKGVSFNTDALRLAMFKSLDAIDHIRQTDHDRLYIDVFGAMDYATTQVLMSGHSVVYDAQQTKRRDRKNIEKLAESAGAIPILVWIKTDPQTALRRGQERDAAPSSLQYTEEKMNMLINRFYDVTDLPEPSENTIEINGELPFEEQYAAFEHGVEAIRHKR